MLKHLSTLGSKGVLRIACGTESGSHGTAAMVGIFHCRTRRAMSSTKENYEVAVSKIFDKVRATRALQENPQQLKPSKLFAVERIASTFARPYWEKNIIKALGLEETAREQKENIRKPVGSLVVVKNTPEMCKMLWRVKHLIRVKPITFPDGLPTKGQFTGSHLDKNGVFSRRADFEIDVDRLQIGSEFTRTKLDGMEIAKPMHLRWMNSIS